MVGDSLPTRSSISSNPIKPRKDGDGNAIRNKILLGMAAKECTFILRSLVFVSLRLNDVLQEAGEAIQYCYFPNTAMASILNVMDDGKSVEVGLAGWEGFVGMPLVAGFRTSSSRVVTQADGTAYRISADDMRKALRECPKLIFALLRYSQKATMELGQLAACNRLHNVNERLARWLLMTQDRIRKDILPLTHEFLSQMLGTRRASVSVAAGIFQRAGLIVYNRGQVTILNRPELENASCGCYKAICQQLENWEKESSNSR
jgi:CRP-like cAMP-binding protein